MKQLLLTLLLVYANTSYADYYSTTQVCEIERSFNLPGDKKEYSTQNTVSLRIEAAGSPQDYFVEVIIDGWSISSRLDKHARNRHVDRYMTQDRIWVYESYAGITSWIDINRISRVIKGTRISKERRIEYTGICRDARPM